MLACSRDHDSEVESMLQKPQDPNMRNCFGTCPIHFAALFGNLKVARLLVEAGANKEATDAYLVHHNTALHCACQCGHLEVVRMLIEAGANKDAKRTDGSAPLHLATTSAHLEVVQVLLEAGANKEAKNVDGKAPMGS